MITFYTRCDSHNAFLVEYYYKETKQLKYNLLYQLVIENFILFLISVKANTYTGQENIAFGF